MNSTSAVFLLIAVIVCTLVIVVPLLRLYLRRGKLNAGTAPFNFPPDSNMPIGAIQVGNKTGNTGAFSSTVFFTAPVGGWYLLGWGVHINSTDNAEPSPRP